jgi:hypothetical protein
VRALGKLSEAYQYGRAEAATLRQAAFDRWLLARDSESKEFPTLAIAFEAYVKERETHRWSGSVPTAAEKKRGEAVAWAILACVALLTVCLAIAAKGS